MKYLLLLLSAIAYGEAVDGYLTCTVLEGSGKIVGKDNQPLSKGLIFKPDQRVTTDANSTANIFLSSGSKLILNPESVVYFKVLKQVDGSQQKAPEDNKTVKETGPSIVEIEVESGKVIGDVKKLVPNSVFTLKTPVGTVAIKGTVFSVAFTQNKDGTQSFSVGCLVGRVQVQMADPKVAPISVPAGKQLTLTATAQPPAQNGPKADGDGKKESGDKPKDGEKGEQPPPPPPQMKLEALPPAEIKQMVIARPDAPPPPPPAPPAPPVKADALDSVIQRVQDSVNSQQVNPSPTGG